MERDDGAGDLESRGGILGGNPDRSLKSFPPCYSQTTLYTNRLYSPPSVFWTWDFYKQQLGRGGGGYWVNKYMDQWRVSLSQAN